MKKNYKWLLVVFVSGLNLTCYANDVFDILPDLPDALTNAAQASSVTTVEKSVDADNGIISHQEPNFLSVFISLIFVILLIYATGIIYSRLNNFGINSLKKQNANRKNINPTVLSTTPLGGNKTLHVVELEGKRMLIGASANSIHLLKDLELGEDDLIEDGEYSKIEIPSIRIPKIEIPKIEIPGFTKVIKKRKGEYIEDDTVNKNGFVFTEIYEENSDQNENQEIASSEPEGIIDSLFHTNLNEREEILEEENKKSEHSVDPDEFALYKKYIN